MRYLVTGAAGFVGSTLVDRLLRHGHDVVGIDDFSTGQREFVRAALADARFELVEGDLLDPSVARTAAAGCAAIFHLAANADVRYGLEHPRKDFEQNAAVTMNVLEAARLAKVPKLAFSSTGSVYGESRVIPTPENAPFPVQTSLYGASKAAAEGFIAAYAEGFPLQAYIFRFVSLLGERYTHGHVVDFYRQLQAHPERLDVLGNGRQRKSYLYVADCIDAMLTALERAEGKVNIFNLGTDEFCEVNDSIGWICEAMGLQPEIVYSGGERGWVGDNPFIFLDCSAMRALGWRPTLTIREAVERTVSYLSGAGASL